MADRNETVPPRPDNDPGAIADGDAQLDQEPPNVTEAEAAPETDAAADAGSSGTSQSTDALQREVTLMSERHLRLAAEFDNYRKRVERERAEAWTRAQGELAGRMLDVLDDLERVTQHAQGSTQETLLQGVQLVERKFRQALEAAGLEDVAAADALFDPTSMEAVAMVPVEDEAEDEMVSDVFQRGYRFKGTLLRPARVRVKKHGA